MNKKILMVDNSQPFNFDTLYSDPLGGSESSFLLLSKGLAENGDSVILLNNSTVDIPDRSYNRSHHNLSNINSILPSTDYMIVNRRFTPDLINVNIPIIVYCHDAYDQTHMIDWMMVKEFVDKVSLILCVSEWQKSTYHKYFGVPLDKMIVVGNSIDSSMYYGYMERNENKLIYASIPYKGINVIGDIFHDVCVGTKNDDLELHVYSSMKLYGQSDSDGEYEEYYSGLSKMKNVFLHDPICMNDLAKVFMSSGISLHPNTYHESFGMNMIQAQAGGCLPVCVDNGAAREVVNNDIGYITNGKTIYDSKCYNEFVDGVCRFVESTGREDIYKRRVLAQEFSSKWNYFRIAKAISNKLEVL